ncbi:neurogenic locus notch, putative [Perkinsus marinus ATCC 50983]|uniref:Neurogenic locus notch, putative n=1 Tax=Perkinsus marinus (strain ATCC 50983 / TXsc) TaxID=423536 RepID=C5L304_PERM5|nr:neurogenic locus notch, putative [Perkinsus marinus ATCC 50983]EER08891.1 neurogenic locus notch, putative [Perkinsus marinus ATCC 50983]|eukprot:XP_002777075.1 neurogenic locus notch, putative [Perkinsus marinus ATCC 50983]
MATSLADPRGNCFRDDSTPNLEASSEGSIFVPGAHFHLKESFGPSTRKVDEYWRSSLPLAHRPAPDEEQLRSGGPRLYDLDSTIHDSVDPSSFVHALLRTSSMPLGPNLGSYSVDGVYDQKFPLVGMDRVVKENTVTGTKTTGYWPLFGALTAGVHINKGTQSYWREVYGFNGASRTVNCDSGDVVIGVRWRSHAREAARRAAAATGQNENDQDMEANRKLLDIPDIQCTKLITAEVKAYGIDTVYQVKNVTYDTDEQTRAENTIASVKDVQQCMLSSMEGFMIKTGDDSSRRQELNTCSGRLKESAMPSSFIRWMLSARPIKADGGTASPQNLMEIDMGYRADPDIVAQILAGNYSFDNDMFGPTNIESPAAAREEAMNKALGGLKDAWNMDKVPSIESVKSNLPEKPWESSKLIVGSDKFLEGTMLGGRRAMAVTGFTMSTDGMPEFVCGKIVACEKGTCKANGCECMPGYEGPNCDTRTDPCRTKPCGQFGECVENFDKPTGYECQCQATWFGIHCETTTNMCLEKILLENETDWRVRDCGKGNCVSGNGQYECRCEEGWERSTPGLGGKCDQEVQDCVGQWVGSTCNDECMQEMTFKIFQPVRGSGTPCEHPAGKSRTEMCSWGDCKKCMGRDCNGRGTCDVATGVCKCEGAFSGENCELEKTDCSESRCNGHGNCVDDGCRCVNGWTNEGPDNGPLNGVYCTRDPCEGCPVGQCDARTGFCSCRSGTWSDVSRATGEPACELSSGSIDCIGDWGPWSECQSDCQRRRYFSISTLPRNGGKRCPAKGGDEMQEACQMGSCCLLKEADCLNGGTLMASTCDCLCAPGFQGSRCETKVTDADRVLEREAIIDFSGDPVIPEQAEEEPDAAMNSVQNMVVEKKSPVLLILCAILVFFIFAGAAYYYQSEQQKKQRSNDVDPDAFMAE